MSLSAITSSAAPVAPPQRPVATSVPAAVAAPAPKADAVTISPAGHAASSGDGDHDGH